MTDVAPPATSIGGGLSSPTVQSSGVEPLGLEHRDDILEVDQWAFGFDNSDVDPTPVLEALEQDRMFGIWRPAGADGRRRLVALHAALSLQLTVPGGQLPCAGLTWVGVHPAERRRGHLSAMMRQHLHGIHEQGRESVSALWAAEPAIYGRFGYGNATRDLRATLPRGVALRDVPGAGELTVRLEKADPDVHADLVGDCYRAAGRDRTGWVSRDTAAMRRLALDDQPFMRKGAESLRIMIAEGPDGAVRGYALFRRKAAWTPSGQPDSTVILRELVALDAAAARALWGRLTDLDLTARVEADRLALDDPLLQLLVDLRTAAPRMLDAMWLRIVDVGAALAGRRYTGELDVVLAVSDAFCPWNERRWRLQGGPANAVCTAVDDPAVAADVELDVRELAAAYLGGVSFTALAAAGLARARRPELLARLSAAFASPMAPYCGWMF